MSWRFRTPEGNLSSVFPSRETAKAEAVKFSWVRAFANAGAHADFGTPDPDTVSEEFPKLVTAGWAVYRKS